MDITLYINTILAKPGELFLLATVIEIHPKLHAYAPFDMKMNSV